MSAKNSTYVEEKTGNEQEGDGLVVKSAVGKILICIIAVTLCFGFVGVKEVHAATNKVINQNTGASYTNLGAAVAALGNGTGSVTLVVDGTVTDNSDITINYNGELTIKGINNEATILTENNSKIIVSQNAHVKSIENIRFPSLDGENKTTYPYRGSSVHIRCYGTIDSIDNIYITRNGWMADYMSIDVRSGGHIGVISNITSGVMSINNLRSSSVRIEEGASVGTINADLFYLYNAGNINKIVDSTIIDGFFIFETGSVNEIINVQSTRGDYMSYFPPQSGSPSGLMLSTTLVGIYVDGYVGLMENVTAKKGIDIFGTVDTINGGSYTGKYSNIDNGTYAANGDGIHIYSTGKLNVIKGGAKISGDDYDGYDLGGALANDSTNPVYLEPDLNGKDVEAGYVGYLSSDPDIPEIKGSVVYPVSASGYYYKLSDAPLADGYYHLVVSDVKGPVTEKKVPIYKRLIQNGEGTLPDNMTFNFTFEQQSEWEGVQYVSKTTNPTPIGEKSVTITDSDIFTGTDPYVGDLTGKKLYYGEYENVLSDFDPQVAGTYLYLVEEKVPATGALPNVTYTGSEYVLKVVVDSNKEIVDIPTITLYKDSAGKTKNDYTTPPRIFDEKQELIFYNTYGTSGSTTPTGIMTNIVPFIIIGGAALGILTLYVVITVRRKNRDSGI